MKAAHVLRRPDEVGNKAATKHKRAPAAEVPAVQYPPGFFLALVRQHNWPPQFEPRTEWAPRRGLPPEQLRAAGGFDGNALNLPGAVEHLQRAGVR